MAYYPTPRNEDEIFNPNNFPTSNPLSNLGEFALLYPNAQGAITFTETVAGTLNVLEIGAGGIEYNGTNVSFEKIAAIQALSSASNNTTLNINKTLQIQNGETTAPPTSFISLDTSGNLMRMNLCANGTTNNYGSATQVLTSGGAGGSLSWQNAGAGGTQNLNSVLTQGNTTTLNAIFNSATPSQPQTTINNAGMTVLNGAIQNEMFYNATTLSNGLNTNTLNATSLTLADTSSAPAIITNTVEDNKLTITNTTGIQKTIILDNSTVSPYIGLLNNDNSPTLTQAIFDMDSLLFYTGTNPLALSAIGMERNNTGLQLTTNGTLTLNGLGGSSGQFLKQNATGNAVWDTVSTNPTFSDVLTNNNTTQLTAIFNSVSPSTPTTTVLNTGIGISNGPIINTITQAGMAIISGLEQTAYEADGIEYTLSSAGITTAKTIINDDIALQGFTAGLLTSTVGIEKNGTGLQLNTNGTLSFNGLGGTNGDILVYTGGNAFWQAPPAVSTVQSGTIANPVYSATTPTNQLFGTPYVGLNPPPVTLTVNTGTGSTSIVVAGIAGYSSTGSGASTNWTGFNWFISGAVPIGGTLNWIAD